MDGKYIECGKVSNTHGYKGAVKIIPLTDYPEVIEEIGYVVTEDGKKRKILSLSYFKDLLLVTLEGIDSMEKAEALKGRFVYALRDDIPMDGDSHFIADLIGLPVLDADTGVGYGTLEAIDNFGASDIYTVKTKTGRVMIPAVDEFVIRVDIEEGIFIRPIEGLLDEN